MQNTELLYLKDFNLLASQAKVLEVTKENDKDVVLLDQTIFYAQGGGQPYDQGVIESSHGKFLVEEVRFVEGIIKHIGTFETGNFEPGETVSCHVDAKRRSLHSRLHSAGHIVDMGVYKIGLGWIPGKGYHFPDGPYVEYEGSLENLDVEKVKKDLEAACNAFVQEGRATELRFMDKKDMHTVCHHVPEYLPEGKPARVVLYGDFGVPCGGTHVKNLSEVGIVTIRKIKSKGKGIIRVGYDIVQSETVA